MTSEQIEVLKGGLQFSEPGTHRLLFTEEPIGMQCSSDLIIRNVTFRGLMNFAQARKGAILKRKKEAHIQADTRNSTISLIVGEHGGRKTPKDYDRVPQLYLSARAIRHEDFSRVLNLLEDSHPSAHDLAMDLRTRPYLFENEQEWMRVVGALRNTNLKIQKIRKETSDDAGMREKRMQVEVTEGGLDLTWNFSAPVFQGEDRRLIPVRAIWEVQDDWSVHVVLLSYDVVALERQELQNLMDNTIKTLNNILGLDELPVVYTDSGKTYAGS